MYTHGTRARVMTVVLAVVGFLATGVSAQNRLDGAWELTEYDSRASAGKASGLLTFASGRFSLIYTMDEPGGRTSGRAHAGRFERSGDAMTLHVDWTMEYVNGKGQAQRGGNSRRIVKIAMDGDALSLTYENGSIQRFQRVKAAR